METFKNIDEELEWAMFKFDGNPYIVQDLINERYKFGLTEKNFTERTKD